MPEEVEAATSCNTMISQYSRKYIFVAERGTAEEWRLWGRMVMVMVINDGG